MDTPSRSAATPDNIMNEIIETVKYDHFQYGATYKPSTGWKVVSLRRMGFGVSVILSRLEINIDGPLVDNAMGSRVGSVSTGERDKPRRNRWPGPVKN